MRKETPLYATIRDGGAPFMEDAGWLLPRDFGDALAAVAAARQGVALADRSARGKVVVAGGGASDLLQRLWGAAAMAVHRGAPVAAGRLYRLRQDRFFLSTDPGAAAGAVAAIEAAVGPEDGLITASDVSHGLAELWLLGPAAATLLSRLCGLEFHPDIFPDQTAKESSVAKTKQLIVRHDVGGLPGYALLGGRSYGAYLWDTIVDAARDLPFALLGEAALRQLEATGS